MATSSERLVAGLRRHGMPLDLVQFAGGSGGVERKVELGGIRIIAPMGDDPEHGLNLLFATLVAEARPWTHLVAFGGQLPMIAGPVFAAWLGRPLVTMLRGNDFDTAVFHPHKRAALGEALARSAHVMTVSREMRDRVRALHPSVAVSTVANGIAMHQWQALPSDRAAAAAWRNGNVDPGRCVVGMIGQIKAKKGGVLLLESLLRAGLADRVHLLFVGALDPEVQQLMQSHPELKASCTAPVDRDMLIPWYLACDAVALPSLYDGMPNVLLEAGALGVPVIAARAGGIPDVIRDPSQGWLFAPGDGESCREAIASFLAATTETRTRVGLNLRKRIALDFTEEREIGAVQEVLRAASREVGQSAAR
jgi:glycosyltransferase involved in cell wall biosynthesis